MPKVVLVVEDDPGAREVFSTFLDARGYRVVQAADGQEGLEAAHRERPDIVVMDIAMPRMNGLDLARALRADPAVNGVRLVAVTAHLFPSPAAAEARELFDDVLSKPLPLRELEAAVARFLRPEPRA